eukprot:gene19092-biopygen25106
MIQPIRAGQRLLNRIGHVHSKLRMAGGEQGAVYDVKGQVKVRSCVMIAACVVFMVGYVQTSIPVCVPNLYTHYVRRPDALSNPLSRWSCGRDGDKDCSGTKEQWLYGSGAKIVLAQSYRLRAGARLVTRLAARLAAKPAASLALAAWPGGRVAAKWRQQWLWRHSWRHGGMAAKLVTWRHGLAQSMAACRQNWRQVWLWQYSVAACRHTWCQRQLCSAALVCDPYRARAVSQSASATCHGNTIGLAIWREVRQQVRFPADAHPASQAVVLDVRAAAE